MWKSFQFVLIVPLCISLLLFIIYFFFKRFLIIHFYWSKNKLKFIWKKVPVFLDINKLCFIFAIKYRGILTQLRFFQFPIYFRIQIGFSLSRGKNYKISSTLSITFLLTHFYPVPIRYPSHLPPILRKNIYKTYQKHFQNK